MLCFHRVCLFLLFFLLFPLSSQAGVCENLQQKLSTTGPIEQIETIQAMVQVDDGLFVLLNASDSTIKLVRLSLVTDNGLQWQTDLLAEFEELVPEQIRGVTLIPSGAASST